MTVKPIKLLFVTAEPHPSFRADVRVLFGKYLPRHGIQSDLVAQSLPDQAEAPWPAGRTWLVPRLGGAIKRVWLQWRHDLRLFALARQGYDAVQVRDRVLAGAIGLLAARRAGIPFFYWASYPKPEARLLATRIDGLKFQRLAWLINQVRGRLASALLYRWLLPRADHIFVQSEAMKQSFVGRGLLANRMTAVPMGVDLEEASTASQPSSEWLGRLRGREFVYYLGALDHLRNPDLMLEALSLLRLRRPLAGLLLVGGTSDEITRLEARAVELGVRDAVQFAGWLSAADATGLASCCQVGISVIPRGPLFDVSSPTKLPEYLAQGLPVVANDLPDQQSVLIESGAGICVQGNAEAVAAGIDLLLADQVAAKLMGERGREYVRGNRSYAAISERLSKAYFSLIG